jgi:hypothetical protein
LKSKIVLAQQIPNRIQINFRLNDLVFSVLKALPCPARQRSHLKVLHADVDLYSIGRQVHSQTEKIPLIAHQ